MEDTCSSKAPIEGLSTCILIENTVENMLPQKANGKEYNNLWVYNCFRYVSQKYILRDNPSLTFSNVWDNATTHL